MDVVIAQLLDAERRIMHTNNNITIFFYCASEFDQLMTTVSHLSINTRTTIIWNWRKGATALNPGKSATALYFLPLSYLLHPLAQSHLTSPNRQKIETKNLEQIELREQYNHCFF